MRPWTALGLALLAPLALADVKFTVPAAGASISTPSITITWADSGDAPALADLTTFQLFLYSGSNESPVQLASLSTGGTFATDPTSIAVTIDAGLGGNLPNAYFLGMISNAAAGGTVTNYSDRFTLSYMTGVFSAAVQTALGTVTGTAGPPTVNNVAAPAPAAGSSSIIAGDPWGTPYNLQTGLTRYAPMQPLPGTTITATKTDPLWPTSSVPTATTFLPIPSIVTTLTQPGTFSFQSHENTASPAVQPSDDMAKFLARWRD